VSLDDDAQSELRELADAHRRRIPRVVDGAQGSVIQLDGREVINFASNDYLGLAGDPRLARAACAALEASGNGSGASRLIVGNQREHVVLEAALADWLRVGGVRLFNAGYAANVGVLTMMSDAIHKAHIAPTAVSTWEESNVQSAGPFTRSSPRGASLDSTTLMHLLLHLLLALLVAVVCLYSGRAFWAWVLPVALLLGGIGAIMMAQAYRVATPSIVVPFEYTGMVWGVGLGFLIWGDVPDLWIWVGSVVVIGSGLYILHRETRRGAPASPPAAAANPAGESGAPTS